MFTDGIQGEFEESAQFPDWYSKWRLAEIEKYFDKWGDTLKREDYAFLCKARDALPSEEIERYNTVDKAQISLVLRDSSKLDKRFSTRVCQLIDTCDFATEFNLGTDVLKKYQDSILKKSKDDFNPEDINFPKGAFHDDLRTDLDFLSLPSEVRNHPSVCMQIPEMAYDYLYTFYHRGNNPLSWHPFIYKSSDQLPKAYHEREDNGESCMWRPGRVLAWIESLEPETIFEVLEQLREDKLLNFALDVKNHESQLFELLSRLEPKQIYTVCRDGFLDDRLHEDTSVRCGDKIKGLYAKAKKEAGIEGYTCVMDNTLGEFNQLKEWRRLIKSGIDDIYQF